MKIKNRLFNFLIMKKNNNFYKLNNIINKILINIIINFKNLLLL